jgi:hypothetical protein
MKRLLTGGGALAVWLSLMSFLAFAGQASAASCAVSGSTTQVVRGDLRIYRVGNSAWVCSTLFGRHIRLTQHRPHVDLWKRPSRRTFAYAFGNGVPTAIFGSRDLKTGAVLHHHFVNSGFNSVTADRLVARRDGSIAYIYSWIGSNTHDAGNTVEKVDTAGFHMLDGDCVLCSNQINTSFLRIVGNMVEWMDNSMTKSAPLN